MVGLGFGVDDASLRKFNAAIQSATLKSELMAQTIVGAAKNIVSSIASISTDFEELGYQYRLIVPAINKAIILRRELFNAYAKSGVKLQDVVLKSYKLNLSLTKTKYAIEALYRSTASRFFDELAKQSDLFRKKVYENMPAIQSAINNFVKVSFDGLKYLYRGGERFWNILVKLHKETDGWSTALLGIAASWNTINNVFLATPITRLITLGLVLFGLWNDLKDFNETGKSFVDWTSNVVQVTTALISLFGIWTAAVYAANAALAIYNGQLTIAATLSAIAAAPAWLIVGAFTALAAIVAFLDDKFRSWTGGHIFDSLRNIGSGILGFIGGPFQGAPVGNFNVPKSASLPSGGNYSNQSSSVNNAVNVNIHPPPGTSSETIGKTYAGDMASYLEKYNRTVNMSGRRVPGGNF